jgi:hypothetical protein
MASVSETFNHIAGFSMSELNGVISKFAGAMIVLCAAVLVAVAIYQLMDDREISYFTFVITLFFTMAFTAIFLLFISIY